MTNPQHRRFLLEVGVALAAFATRSEVRRIQEELAHHLEEKKYILLDLGLSEEEAELQSIKDLGSRKAVVREARSALRGPIRRLNASAVLGISSFYLVNPLKQLAVDGRYSFFLGVLCAIVSFYLLITGVQLGARITFLRLAVMTILAGGAFHVPVNDIIQDWQAAHEDLQETNEFLVMFKWKVKKAQIYRDSKGMGIRIAPSPPDPIPNLTIVTILDEKAPKGSPLVPPEPASFLESIRTRGIGKPMRFITKVSPSAIAWNWASTALVIWMTALAASFLGERIRAGQDRRTHLPPPMPIGPGSS